MWYTPILEKVKSDKLLMSKSAIIAQLLTAFDQKLKEILNAYGQAYLDTVDLAMNIVKNAINNPLRPGELERVLLKLGLKQTYVNNIIDIYTQLTANERSSFLQYLYDILGAYKQEILNQLASVNIQ